MQPDLHFPQIPLRMSALVQWGHEAVTLLWWGGLMPVWPAVRVWTGPGSGPLVPLGYRTLRTWENKKTLVRSNQISSVVFVAAEWKWLFFTRMLTPWIWNSLGVVLCKCIKNTAYNTRCTTELAHWIIERINYDSHINWSSRGKDESNQFLEWNRQTESIPVSQWP